jgi:cell wall-associated NlpC family hydrolase
MPVEPRRGERRARARRYASAIVVLALSAAALYGCGEASAPAPQAQRIVIRTGSAKGKPIGEQKPPRPQHLDVASRAEERSARSAPKVKLVRGDPSKMPAASAGTNGSFTPPAGGARKSMNAHTMAGVGNLPASRSAILLHGVALAPPSAPDAVKRAISAANQIVGTPYVWGGGHSSWRSRGYDCSGAVSDALAGGGFLSAPLASSQLESWGAPGPGRWITVYANAGHTYAVIAGLRWDTVGDAQGSGPRWHPALPYPHGFTVRHPPGY